MSGTCFSAVLGVAVAAALAGCGSLPTGSSGSTSARSAGSGAAPTALDPNQPVKGFRTAASDVFRHEAAAPPFEGYISGR